MTLSPIFDRLRDAQIASTDSWSSKAYWRGFSYLLVLKDALRAWDEGTVTVESDTNPHDSHSFCDRTLGCVEAPITTRAEREGLKTFPTRR